MMEGDIIVLSVHRGTPGRSVALPSLHSLLRKEAWLKSRMRSRTLPASGPLHSCPVCLQRLPPAISPAHPFLTHVSTFCLLLSPLCLLGTLSS